MGPLRYTGHPFVDVGLATLTAFAHKRHPRELSHDDLQAAADYMARNYVVNPLKSFLSVAFTSNAWFIQNAYDPDKPGLSPEKRAERRRQRNLWRDRHLYQWVRSAGDRADERDVFTGLPVVAEPLSQRLLPGRGARAQIPLTLGDEYINFLPHGDPGIPISGMSILALYMMPLGCAKVAGRLLAVHSDDPELILHFARTFLRENLKNIQAAQAAGAKKLPDTTTRRARTLLIEHLIEATRAHRQSSAPDVVPPTLTAYHFTNSGQGADLTIYPLPLEVAGFVAVATSPNYRDAWDALVARGWQITRAKRGREAPPPAYNRLYEDLFGLPEQAVAFVRRYFLRRPDPRGWGREDPTRAYDTRREASLISWRLTQLFLEKVVLMDELRIQHIRELGDDLATYIVAQNDRRFFRDFYMARHYGQVRAALIKASQAQVKRGQPPLVTLERFLAVFEQTEGVPQADWRLGRDLVLIRMFERLFQQGWLQEHAHEIPEEEEEEEDVEHE